MFCKFGQIWLHQNYLLGFIWQIFAQPMHSDYLQQKVMKLLLFNVWLTSSAEMYKVQTWLTNASCIKFFKCCSFWDSALATVFAWGLLPCNTKDKHSSTPQTVDLNHTFLYNYLHWTTQSDFHHTFLYKYLHWTTQSYFHHIYLYKIFTLNHPNRFPLYYVCFYVNNSIVFQELSQIMQKQTFG